MFIGELLCMGAYLIILCVRKYRWNRTKHDVDSESEPQIPRFNPLLFLIPAISDIISTSVMYIGLTLTSASSYQMLRGALIVCTGLLSIFCLHSTIKAYQWMGMISVVLGLAVIGLTDIFCNDNKTDEESNVLVGDLLCILAQLVSAVQLVFEQKYMRQYDVDPLLAVGLEGIYGIVILLIAMFPMYFIHVSHTFSSNPYGRLEDPIHAWHQICKQPMIAVALTGTTISIAFFNFAGTTVTKNLSATTRTVLDSVRTIVIWAASLPLFGQKFIPLQLIGFALLIFGMFVYNDILIGPWFRQHVLPRIYDIPCFGPRVYILLDSFIT
ncbi:hypothetical protein Q1695_012018 [Nippostrongylus brasiliensis]|nr:hypothetical protein Q1695_012018 [Nippostrongylus brasiliensis]